MVLAPGSDSRITESFIDPSSRITVDGLPYRPHTDPVVDAGGDAVDPNKWAKDAINALNNAEQLLQQLTSAISGNTEALAALDGHTYGYELTAAGTSGDTLAAAFISTKVQSITGGVTENSMTAARRPQEIGKKVWG